MNTVKLLTDNESLFGYLWLFVVIGAMLGPLYVLYKIFEWSKYDWSTHPIAQNLATYSNNNTSWRNVASDINIEYRRFVRTLQSGSICKRTRCISILKRVSF